MHGASRLRSNEPAVPLTRDSPSISSSGPVTPPQRREVGAGERRLAGARTREAVEQQPEASAEVEQAGEELRGYLGE